MIKEIWKDIKNYEGEYQISNFGRVRSLDRMVKHPTGSMKKWKGRILKLSERWGKRSKTKYHGVCFRTNENLGLVHRLVAQAFIPNPENKPCVNHLDGNGLNNNIKNLAWCTYSENEKWSYEKLGKKLENSHMKGKKGLKNSWTIPIASLDENGNIQQIFESSVEAENKLGLKPLSNRNIRAICQGKRKRCYGYTFKDITREEFYNLKQSALFK